ncbi:MAG: amidohydrolase [Candidatus Aminicenantes bacterium]|nr:amidohydrolase [Candidatus Aminicenantes bacterium]
MKNLTFVLLIIVISFQGSSKSFPAADLILVNGKILTMDSRNPVTSSIVIVGNKIQFTGDDAGSLKFRDKNSKVIDLQGKTVIPGLHDAHLHFEGGSDLISDRLSLRFLNKEQILKKIEDAVKASPEGALIRAYSYNHAYFKDKKFPDKYDLDKVAPKNPVIITRVDGHSIWVNSMTLKMAGISKETPDPQGGELIRFKDNNPTGILKENAEMMVGKVTGPRMVVLGSSGENKLLNAIRFANKLGLTSVTTQGSLKLMKQLNEIDKTGELTLRFNLWISPAEMKRCVEKGINFRSGSDKVRISFVKIFADGSLGSVSAAFFKPYTNNPKTSGILIHPIEELDKLISDAHKNGFQAGVHAIGNRGVHLVLNAVEKAQQKFGMKGLRHRIEHTQFITDEDLLRFNKLKMIPSMQPTHCTTDLLVVEERIGKERAKQGYRWNSFKKEGVMLAFGTDWPVEPLDPRRGLYSSIERKNIENGFPENGWFPGEQISITDAIRYYTLGAAYASFNEKRIGSIESGKLADLTIFDADLEKIIEKDKKNMLKVKIYKTIMDGKIVNILKK